MNTLDDEIIQIKNAFYSFSKRNRQIKKYIESVYKQKDFIVKVNGVINKEDKFLNQYIADLSTLANSVVLYNAAIISMYGSYELLLDEIFKSYINHVRGYYNNYNDIPQEIKTKHYNKSIEFISNPNRFMHYELDNKTVIENLYECENNNSIHNLTDNLLISHSGNMNSKQLNILFGEFGIKDSVSKLKKNKKLIEFCESLGIIEELKNSDNFPILDALVKERNNVAHGWVIDNRISYYELLMKNLPFINHLGEAISELLISNIIEKYINDKKLQAFDSIIHIWKNGEIFGINNKEANLKVGTNIYCNYLNGCFGQLQIVNLRNGKKDRQYIRKKNTDISVQIMGKVKQNYILYYAPDDL